MPRWEIGMRPNLPDHQRRVEQAARFQVRGPEADSYWWNSERRLSRSSHRHLSDGIGMSGMVDPVAIQALHLVGEQIVARRDMLIVLEPYNGLNVALEAIGVAIWLAHGKNLGIGSGEVLVNLDEPLHLG